MKFTPQKGKSMIGNATLKNVLKKYPALQSHYRFFSAAQNAVSNRLLKKRRMRTFAGRLASEMEGFSPQAKSKDFLEEMLDRTFRKTPPSDELLHLLADLIPFALLCFLAEKKSDEEAEERWQRAVILFEGYLRLDQRQLYLCYSAVHRILLQRGLFCYGDSDEQTRDAIRRMVYRYAKRHGIKDREAATTVPADYMKRELAERRRYFRNLIVLMPLLLFALALIYCGLLPSLLLLLPIFTLCCEMIFAAASLCVTPDPIFKLKNAPIDQPVLVVITTLLTSKEEIVRLAERLEVMYFQNPEKKACFGILADFKDGKNREEPSDELLEKEAFDAITRLNRQHGQKFCLFIRQRSYAPADKIYMGWERKRGALIELVRLIKGERHSFRRIVAPKELLSRCAYILTLDADTDLRIGALSTMYAAMRHPENRPVIKNGIVVEGYGVLQPRMVSSVRSAARTPFALLHSGGGGLDSYRNALFDFYQSVFGKGAFCGKGMFDVDAFYQVINDAFPEGQILSHDLLEGTRLRCGYLSELALTDATPAGALSYFARQHRWLRGDLQALPFAFKRVQSGQGKVKNPIDRLSRFMILSNVTRLLTPVFSLLALLFSTLLRESTCGVFLFFSLAYLLFPAVLTLLRSARYVGRRFYSSVMQSAWHSLCRTLFALCGLAYDAQLSLDALLRVLFRKLISGKKLLEWVTADQGERKYKNASQTMLLLLYLKKALPSVLAGLFMVLWSEGGPVRLLGLSFVLFPLLCYLFSRPYKKRRTISKEEEKTLLKYVDASFSFFEQFVGEKSRHLPPDNYQEMPVPRLAKRTSPTNIALYLSSCMAMADLGLRGREEMTLRMEQTADTLLALPKYRGHLYNWYHTESGEPLGTPYISTVDSGNLALCLLSLKMGLDPKDPRQARLKEKLELLLREMDFSFLYRRDRGLLCIGYDPVEERQSEGCYDLLASEARSAYFYAIAKGQIDVESWGRLGRPITVKEGHPGILSWSGTAFEYFMPVLFLPLEENTLLYEALCFALYEQSRDRLDGLWGRSESCYFAFDDMMNYQYRAFGCQSLALDPETAKHRVLAPYASFLTLCLAPSQSIGNLKRFEKAGAYGGCGFYEAVDFTPDRVGRGNAVIRCYMAHHVGMSITAAANALLDGIFSRRTLLDGQMRSAEELLFERVPADAPVTRIKSPSSKRLHQPRSLPHILPSDFGSFGENALLYSGSTAVCASDKGGFSLSFDGIALTVPSYGTTSKPAITLCGKGFESSLEDSTFLFDGRALRYELPMKKDGMKLSISPSKEGGVLFRFNKPRGEEGRLRILLHLALCTKEEYQSHPAFSGLSVECFYDGRQKILYFKKRPKRQEDRPLYFALTMTLPYRFFTKKEEKDSSERSFTLLNQGEILPCRVPFVLLDCALSAQEQQFALLCAAGYSRREVQRRLELLLSEERIAIARKSGSKRLLQKAPRPLLDRTLFLYSSLLLEGLLHPRKRRTDLPCYPIADLWRYGISGDLPVFTFLLPRELLSDSQKKAVTQLLKAHRYLSFGGVQFDMVFLRTEEESYFSPAKKELVSLVEGVSGKGLSGHRGGVHLLFDRDAENVLPSFSTVFLFLERDCLFPQIKKAFCSCLEPEDGHTPLTVMQGEAIKGKERELLGLPCGSFTDGGFSVNKRQKSGVPFSAIYASAQFGTLVTDRSLGFTWFRNSGEFRLTPFLGSEDALPTGERLLLTVDGLLFDLAACAFDVQFQKGCALYCGSAGVIDYRLYAGVDPSLPVKVVVLTVKNRSPLPVALTMDYALTPCLGKQPDGLICEKRVGDTLFFKRSAVREPADLGLYLSSSHSTLTLPAGGEQSALFLLGSVHLKNDRCYYHVKSRFATPEDGFAAFSRYAEEESAFSSPFTLDCGEPALSLYLNDCLPRQIRRCRLFARTGFYQPGGAYGFRDQLQDALGLLYHDPRLLERQIYRCAAHQYYNGDVQHWWHPLSYDSALPTDPGVRTECSDDLLWLPLCLSLYIEATGNAAILERQISYLSSPPLKEGEERYERPQRTTRKESLYDHALRALCLVNQRRSARGLCRMGSCDWNDGLSEVKGESVWLTQFYLLCLQSFSPLFKGEDRCFFKEVQAELSSALDRYCKENDRFLRAFFEDGSPLGSQNGSYCQIDLLPQAFAVFLDPCDLFAKKAINSAYTLLWQKNEGLFRLFAPSYDHEEPFPGYLGGYCPGFRENGGQYTHAAVWGAMALLLAGDHPKGFEVLRGINPITLWQKEHPVYALEPYCLAGDVYFAKGLEGRGGWSHYTGSAGWYLTALLCLLLGYREHSDFFTLTPRLCEDFQGFTLTVRKKQTEYRIQVTFAEQNEIILDGKRAQNRFFFDKGRHNVKILLQKEKK